MLRDEAPVQGGVTACISEMASQLVWRTRGCVDGPCLLHELGVIMGKEESQQRLKNSLPPISNGSREDLIEPEGPEGF